MINKEKIKKLVKGKINELIKEVMNEPIEVPIVVEEGGIIPQKSTSGSAAYDLILSEDTNVKYGRFLAKLNIRFQLPYGYAAIIKPRSGFTLKGMEVVNQYEQKINIDANVNDGVIDCDYTGIVGVLMQNHMPKGYRFTIKKGTKVAQMLIVKVADVNWKQVIELKPTERGEGGYGHTGAKAQGA